MRKTLYFSLLLKKYVRALPALLAIVLVLLFCAFFSVSFFQQSENEKNSKIEIAIVGDPADSYLSIGMAALKNFDSSRFAISIDMMDADEAEKALLDGILTAYIVVPENFVLNAFHGDVGKLKYVTRHGSAMMGDFVKEEILNVISVILVESQRGVYASGELAEELVPGRKYGEVTDLAALEYVNLILERNKIFDIETVETVDGIGMMQSIFCGALVFIILLFGIGASGVLSSRNDSLSMLLRSGGMGYFRQVICEYFALFAVMSLAFAIMLGGAAFFLGEEISSFIGYEMGIDFYVSVFLSLAVFAALLLLIFEMTDGIMAGALTHFFASLVLCYFSGCLYPISFFPVVLQKASPFTVTGCARGLLINSLTGDDIKAHLFILAIYLFLFIALCVLFRYRRMAKGGGEE